MAYFSIGVVGLMTIFALLGIIDSVFLKNKLGLAEEFQNDRGSYTAGKHGLIDQFLQEAKLWRSTIAD